MAATDPFRINMALGFCATVPASPAHPGGGTWDDVTNWQNFLLGMGNLMGPVYPNNQFDSPTQTATKAFQGGNGLPATGTVNQATYNKAVSQGMPPYPTVLG